MNEKTVRNGISKIVFELFRHSFVGLDDCSD